MLREGRTWGAWARYLTSVWHMSHKISAFMRISWLIWYVHIRAAHARYNISTLRKRDDAWESHCDWWLSSCVLLQMKYRGGNSRVMMIQFSLTVCCQGTESCCTQHSFINHYIWFISPHVFIWMTDTLRVYVHSHGSLCRKMLAKLGKWAKWIILCVFCHPSVLFALFAALKYHWAVIWPNTQSLQHSHGQSHIGCPRFLKGSD